MGYSRCYWSVVWLQIRFLCLSVDLFAEWARPNQNLSTRISFKNADFAVTTLTLAGSYRKTLRRGLQNVGSSLPAPLQRVENVSYRSENMNRQVCYHSEMILKALFIRDEMDLARTDKSLWLLAGFFPSKVRLTLRHVTGEKPAWVP